VSQSPPIARVGVESILARLAKGVATLGGPTVAAVATDGDGTLWTSDVGEALFEEILRREMVTDVARDALVAEARENGMRVEREDAITIVRAMWDGYLHHRFSEERMCAVMTWCMAGHTLAEIETLSTELLEGPFDLRMRLIREAGEVLVWAHAQQIPVWLVSASPRHVVERAAVIVADELKVPVPRVLAMTPRVENGVIVPGTVGILPYGEGKAVALERELVRSDRKLLCAMGDNAFDAHMLRAAKIPIAIRPKAALTAIASTVVGLVRASTFPPPR